MLGQFSNKQTLHQPDLQFLKKTLIAQQIVRSLNATDTIGLMD